MYPSLYLSSIRLSVVGQHNYATALTLKGQIPAI